MTQDVRDYFEKAFVGYIYDEEDPGGEILATMELDSNCGEDCKKAIDAGAALLKHVRNAHGDWPKGEIMANEIGDIVVDICGCYITG